MAGSRLKMGVIGCGAIAQIQHLPHLRELADQFEIAGLCDLSQKLMARLGEEYDIARERQFLDYRDLVRSDIDAVIVCPSGSHAPASIAAAEAGKHVFVEKPMCVTVREAAAMVAAADRAGVVLQVGYMKRHEPAYRFARERIRAMPDVRFVQVNHLHPDNALHLAEFGLHRFDDIPAEAPEAPRTERDHLVAEALGLDQVPPAVMRAFGDLEDFEETLEVYGSRERVIVSFPTGFSRGLPSTVTLKGMDPDGTPWTKQYAWHDNPFKLELQHFRDCILSGEEPITPGREAVADIALVRDIILTHVAGSE